MKIYTIGRSDDNDIVLSDASISRHHAELQKLGDNVYRIIDRGSSLGTFVRGGDDWVGVNDADISGDERIMLGEWVTSVRELPGLGLPFWKKPKIVLAAAAAAAVMLLAVAIAAVFLTRGDPGPNRQAFVSRCVTRGDSLKQCTCAAGVLAGSLSPDEFRLITDMMTRGARDSGVPSAALIRLREVFPRLVRQCGFVIR